MTDHRIFAKLTHHWENEFHEDMKALNVCVQHKSRILCAGVIHSSVSIQSIPLIDTRLTHKHLLLYSILGVTVDWHLSQNSVDNIDAIESINTCEWVDTANYRQTDNCVVDRVSIEISTKYQSRCQWSVDGESIKGNDQYSNRGALSTHNYKSIVNICIHVGP